MENDQNKAIDISAELNKGLTIHTNIRQDIIVTNADKLELILKDAQRVMESKRDWLTPSGIILTLIITFCTTDFKETFGLSKDFWKSSFVLSTIIMIGYLVYTIIKISRNKGQYEIDDIIKKIKLEEKDLPAQA